MIEKAHKFILKFVEDEYKVNRSAFDRNVSRTDHGNFVDKFLNTYYTPFYADILYGNMASMSLEHLSDEVVEKTYNSRIIRTPYLIRHYTNGRYGKGIQIKSKDRFDCFLGPDNTHIDNGIYLENFSIAIDSNGDFKIVSIRTYFINKDGEQKTLEWGYEDRSLEKKEGVTVLDDGECIESLKLVEPEIPLWKAHFNSFE